MVLVTRAEGQQPQVGGTARTQGLPPALLYSLRVTVPLCEVFVAPGLFCCVDFALIREVRARA